MAIPDPIPSLHVLGSREFGGADQFFVRLVRALHEAGQPVTAITRPASPVAQALAGDPVENVHLPMANPWDLWSRWEIRRHIGRHQPCIVQTYMGRATRLTRVPARARAIHIARLGGFYKIDGYYRHAHAWVGNTRAICDFLIENRLPAHRVFHIGNFTPDPLSFPADELAALRREHAIPADARVLFALGRLIAKKGFSDLLRALALVPAEPGGRPMVLVIAGDGPDLPKLQALAEELQITARVRFVGWQNPPDRFYALADAFICPSRHEPLGNVILEAWNHRLPVISTRNEGAQELIDEGETGLLCQLRDPADIAAAITRLWAATDTERAALAAAGNARLHERYGKRKIVEEYLTLYRDLLEGGEMKNEK